MYKLVAIDMDGTLLNSKKQVSKENITTINEAIKKGIKIVICTGRPYSGIKPYTEIMGLDTEKEYIISQNGSYVVNGTETEVVSAKYLKSKEVNDILYFLEQLDIGKILVTPEDYLAYNCKINEEMKYDASLVFKEIKKFDEDNERLDNLDVLKVMIMDKVEKIEHLSNRIPKVIIDNFYVVRSTPYLIEIMAKNTDKGYGLSQLAKHLNINHDEIIAIGDELNDVGMFNIAGLKVAMQNANNIIKEKANFITLSNDDHGVSYAIKHFILK